MSKSAAAFLFSHIFTWSPLLCVFPFFCSVLSLLFAFVFPPAHPSKATYSHSTTAWGLVEVMHPAVNAFHLTVNGLTWTTQCPWFWIPEFVLQQMCYFTLTHSHAHSATHFPLASIHITCFFSCPCFLFLIHSCSVLFLSSSLSPLLFSSLSSFVLTPTNLLWVYINSVFSF